MNRPFLLALAAITPLLATSAQAAGATSAQAADAPAEPIAALATALSQQSGDFKSRYDALSPAITHALDIPTILHNAIGLRWSTLPPDQQAKLLDIFTKFTIASYVTNFGPGDKSELIAGERTLGQDVAVPTRITPKSGDPTRIDYLMHNEPNGWQATDVLLDGTISRVAVQRSDFRAGINGRDATRLITDLASKVTSLSGGAITP